MAPPEFGPDVRLELCRSCGAALDAPADGGTLVCDACGAEAEATPRKLIRLRLARPGMDSSLDGAMAAARLEALTEQAASYDADSPYVADNAPAGLEYVNAPDKLTPTRILRAQQSLLTALTRLDEGGGDSKQEHTVAWLARRLPALLDPEDDRRGRAMLQAAEHSLRDPVHKHLLRCHLAWRACTADDLRGAADWLALCDPAPWLLEPDTALRLGQAALAAGRLSWDMVLELVGEKTGDLPSDPAGADRLRTLRNLALENLGRQPEPDDGTDDTSGESLTDSRDVTAEIEQEDDAPRRGLMRQLAGRTDGLLQPDTEAAPPAPNFKTLLGAVMSLLIGAILGFIYLPDALKAATTADWKETSGHVRSSSIETRTQSTGESRTTEFVPVIVYQYTVSGKQHTSTRITWNREDSVFDSSTEAKQILAKYGTGPVKVYYNPDKPAEAVLKRGRGGGSWKYMIASGGMVALAAFFAGVFLFSLVRRRRWVARSKR